jgi:hypothetical protein
VVADLTFGFGTVPAAVAMVARDGHGPRQFIGCEAERKMVRVAQMRIAEALKGTKLDCTQTAR